MKQSSTDLLNKVKDRLKTLQDSNKRTTGTWKPTGKHVIRMLPYKFNEYPFIELYFHYDLFKTSEISPISFGDPDPIVEAAEKLKADRDRESFLLSRKLMPKMRTYVPVIVRGEENFGVRYWGFGKEIYEAILKYMDDPEYGNVFDPDTGVDFELEYTSPEQAGNNYGKISIKAKRNSTKLAESPELIQKWLNTQTAINEVYKVKSYDELKNMLNEWLDKASEDTGEETGTEDEKAPEVKESKKETDIKSSKVVKDANAAFDELFNKEKKK